MNVTKELLAHLGTDRKGFEAMTVRIVALLERSNAAVEQALTRIYDAQTRSEKASGCTQELNGVGFRAGGDDITGSYYAKQIKLGRHLFEDRMPKARKLAIRYRKQLTVLAFIKLKAKARETSREKNS